MGRPTGRTPRQSRCERCILAHRPCDGKLPICSTCLNSRRGPMNCTYPEGQPSRSELKARKKQEAMRQKELKDEQVMNHNDADEQKVDRADSADGSEGLEEQRGRKRRRSDSDAAESSREEEIDLVRRFPWLAYGLRRAQPLEEPAPRSPSPDPPFDRSTSPAGYNRVDNAPTLEEIGINLANSVIEAFNRDLPKYTSGVLKGLADYRGLKLPDVKLTEEEQKQEREDMERFATKVFAVLHEKDAHAAEKSMKGKE